VSGLALADVRAGNTEQAEPGRGRRRGRARRLLALSLLTTLVVVAACTAAWLARPAQAAAVALLSAPGLLAGLAVIIWAMRHESRPGPRLLGSVGLLVVASLALIPAVVPGTIPVAAAMLGPLLVTVAAYSPLSGRGCAAWLASATVVFGGVVALSGSPAAAEAAAVAAACVLGSGLGAVACRSRLMDRSGTTGRALAASDLYARMRTHEQDLRRQDEFLMMQQETLISQQAELLKLNAELESIARMDALTQLGNRLRLNEDLAQLAARVARHGGAAGILILDLDRFKRLNDTLGHLAGDDALRGVAEVLRAMSRAGDGLYRYGGEEFLVLLHDADEPALAAAGSRYLRAIEEASIPHPDNMPSKVVTASGGATLLTRANVGALDSALRDADEALYEAKATGRNRLAIRLSAGHLVPLEERRAAG
jgi:diguanylate cyclase (GGDEF)-like protein